MLQLHSIDIDLLKSTCIWTYMYKYTDERYCSGFDLPSLIQYTLTNKQTNTKAEKHTYMYCKYWNAALVYKLINTSVHTNS